MKRRRQIQTNDVITRIERKRATVGSIKVPLGLRNGAIPMLMAGFGAEAAPADERKLAGRRPRHETLSARSRCRRRIDFITIIHDGNAKAKAGRSRQNSWTF